MKIIWFAAEQSSAEPGMNPKDVEDIRIIMRQQHGSNAEVFGRQQMHYYRAKPAANAIWKGVLAALRWKAAARESKYGLCSAVQWKKQGGQPGSLSGSDQHHRDTE
jgi:hypothetical protein